MRRHEFRGERCVHCNVNIYDCDCENDECCNEREPMTYTSERVLLDCPFCGRSSDHCQTQAIRGRDACCMACHAAGRWGNHGAPVT